ncbi:hypothetical protein SAMN05892883_0990 [Jatrophihabitans sp. GAS493]|uniref:hypothetical protein n=1 Tax=Jatrophihabitans sp. GAS493 TaxID=1907575 RepID=UPI000BBFAAA3|nr:hypothetical protein [Jatrophihabitans sp. GAS493]SOD71473.1 hypothetical protein SAMN05892883_0990 [Jatrophihabitans sp. GAS493]
MPHLTWEFWRARPPSLPPNAELQPPTATSGPENRPSKVMVGGLVLLVIFDVSVLLQSSPQRLLGIAIVSLAALRQVMASRRRYAAVGPDWVYLREGALARGRWTRISQLKKVTVFTGRKKSTIFLKPAKHARMLRLEVRSTGPTEALRAELARQLVAAQTPGSNFTIQSLTKWLAASV